jgi:hypothetical protein
MSDAAREREREREKERDRVRERQRESKRQSKRYRQAGSYNSNQTILCIDQQLLFGLATGQR